MSPFIYYNWVYLCLASKINKLIIVTQNIIYDTLLCTSDIMSVFLLSNHFLNNIIELVTFNICWYTIKNNLSILFNIYHYTLNHEYNYELIFKRYFKNAPLSGRNLTFWFRFSDLYTENMFKWIYVIMYNIKFNDYLVH